VPRISIDFGPERLQDVDGVFGIVHRIRDLGIGESEILF